MLLGNRVSTKFWELIAQEHGINTAATYCGTSDLQEDKIDVYFNQVKSGHYLARAVLADLEPGCLDQVRAGSFAAIFNPDNYVHHFSSAGNLWAKGYYTEGQEIVEQTLEVVRREAEASDSLQSFEVTHSLGGGTGSGFGSLLMLKLREEYPGKLIEAFSIFPSAKVSDNVLEPYNTTLAMSRLIEDPDLSVCLDNEGLLALCRSKLKIERPVYADLNQLVASAMCGVTASIRFPGQLNTSLRKVCVNTIPFPRLHFFMTAIAPLVPPSALRPFKVRELT